MTENGNELNQEYTYNSNDLGQIYCLNENFLKIAKKRIGEDNLKKLFQEN